MFAIPVGLILLGLFGVGARKWYLITPPIIAVVALLAIWAQDGNDNFTARMTGLYNNGKPDLPDWYVVGVLGYGVAAMFGGAVFGTLSEWLNKYREGRHGRNSASSKVEPYVCAKCRAILPDRTTRCSNCAVAVSPAIPTVPLQSGMSVEQPRKSTRTRLLVAVVIAGVLIASVVITYLSRTASSGSDAALERTRFATEFDGMAKEEDFELCRWALQSRLPCVHADGGNRDELIIDDPQADASRAGALEKSLHAMTPKGLTEAEFMKSLGFQVIFYRNTTTSSFWKWNLALASNPPGSVEAFMASSVSTPPASAQGVTSLDEKENSTTIKLFLSQRPLEHGVVVGRSDPVMLIKNQQGYFIQRGTNSYLPLSRWLSDQGISQRPLDAPSAQALAIYFFKSRAFPGQSYDNLLQEGKELVQQFCRLGLPIYQVDGDSGDLAVSVCNENTRSRSIEVGPTASDPVSAQPATSASPSVSVQSVPTPVQPASMPGGEQRIRALLDEWTKSFKEKDLTRQVDCYAPVMDTYFLRHNVTRDFVQTDKSRAFNAIAEIRTFEISEMTIEFASSSNASVRFRKKWDTLLVSGKIYSGEEIEQLQVANVDGGWKITSEKELQISKGQRRFPQ